MSVRSSRDGLVPSRPSRRVPRKGAPNLSVPAVAHVAVLLAVYRARADWLWACLESVAAQDVPTAWSVECRIGVDGCEATSALLTGWGFGHWYSPENVGPYRVRNTLASLDRLHLPPGLFSCSACEAGVDGHGHDRGATHYATFDADDVMAPDYLATLTALAGTGAIAGSSRWSIGPTGALLHRMPAPYGHGVAVYPREVFERLGGFRPWRVVADDDLIRRAKALGVGVRKWSHALYSRRRHPGALTQAPETALKSELRQGQHREGMAQIRRGELVADLSAGLCEMEWRPSPLLPGELA